MSNLIQLLPEHIANQIAAGEVVQRPASVIKELLENSLDAGASKVSVTVKEAGKNQILVSDNGKGMYPQDAIMCFARHATSKLRQADDLFNLHTFGFRGEAMASIAAVAQVDMRTRPGTEELGTHVYVEGNEIITNEPDVCDAGTTISVKNLFYNVPARRNFLKSNPVEMRHIVDEFQRVALAHPEKSFILKQNDLETYNLSPGKLSQRIVDIFGANYREQLATCHEETDIIKIKGYVGKPAFAKKGRGDQFFFVNHRFIRSNYLTHAVISAYEQMLPPDTRPFFVLFLEIDPRRIDINVHPTKTEIKFEDERSIYALLVSAVKRTLSLHNFTPTLDFENSFHLPGTERKMEELARRTVSGNKEDNLGNYRRKFPEDSARDRSNLKNWEVMFNQGPSGQGIQPHLENQVGTIEPNIPAQSNNPDGMVTVASRLNNQTGAGMPISGNLMGSEPAMLQINNRFLLTPLKSGLLLVDLPAAQERILYEKYIARNTGKQSHSQQVLFPKVMTLSAPDFALALEWQSDFFSFGFRYEVAEAENSLLFTGVPPDLAQYDERELFSVILTQLQHEHQTELPQRERIARHLSKRAAGKMQVHRNSDELGAILNSLFACNNPNFTPSGLPVHKMLSLEMLEALLNNYGPA